jgi:gliding motility-associated-like protein
LQLYTLRNYYYLYRINLVLLQKVYLKVGLAGILISFFLGFVQNSSGQCNGIDFKVMNASQKKGCIPLVSFFQAVGTSSAQGTTFRWDLGNGAFVTGNDTISRIYSISGQYRIRMEATLSGSSTPCLVVKDTFITVLPTPAAVMGISTGTKVCNRSQSVTFTDNTPSSVKREWIIEGNTFTTQSVNYKFSNTGAHPISLTVTNAYGCQGFITQTVNVYDSVMVDICMNATVYNSGKNQVVAGFTPLVPRAYTYAPRNIVQYNWTFPGGSPSSASTSTLTPVKVTYPDNTKKYDVSLTIVMDDGCTYTIYRKGMVSPFITPTFQTKCAGKTFTVSADVSDTGRHNYSFGFANAMIDLGSPPPPDPKTVKLTYNASGSYSAVIKYRYNTPLACFVSINYVNIFNVLGPKADFESKNNQICKGTDTVRFHNTTDTAGAGKIKYTWYIYDASGTTLIKGRNKLGPTYTMDTFYSPGVNGKFGVGLVATSPNGCTDSIVKPSFITVASPKSDFIAATTLGCFGSQIPFTAKPTPPEGKVVTYLYSWLAVSDLDTTVRTAASGKSNVFALAPKKLGPYTISLTVSNGNCSSDTTKKAYVTVIGDNTGINIKDQVGCLSPSFSTTVSVAKETIYPNDPFNPPIYHWHASPTDAPYLIFQDPYAKSTQVFISRSGCYSIYLDIITHLGKDTCKQTFSREDRAGICVGAGLGYYLDPMKCLGDTIKVNNNSDLKTKNFKWSIYPSQYAKIIPNDTARNPSFIFLKDTCYAIKIYGEKVINGSLCKDSIIDSNICMKLPKADFYTTTPKFYCAPAIGRFHNKSINSKFYIWRFDDGDSLYSMADSVSHAYLTLKKGEYNISLTAIDDNGCQSTITKNKLIVVDGPVPNFKMDKKYGCDSMLVQFQNTSKNVNSFYFFYDDGSPILVNQNPGLHSYVLQDPKLDSVIFYPTLLSRDDTVCKVYRRDTLKLYRTPQDVVIKANKTFGCVPMTVTFTAFSRTASSWKWDFDQDGKIDDSLKQSPYFEFKKPGKYRAKLYASNHHHCDNIFYSDTITVLPNTVAGFIPSQQKFCGKQEISFKNNTTDYARFLFDYGDGSPWDSNTIAKHVYYFDPARDKGDSVQFFPKLIAFNAAGCSDTFRLTLTSYAVPVAGFKSSVVGGCAPLTIRFTDTSRYRFATRWDFDNDGIIDATGRIVDWTFTPGLYTVKMQSYSIHGCIDSVVKVNMISVNDPPRPDFSVSDSFICYKGEEQFTNLTQPMAFVRQWFWKFTDPVAPYTTSNQKDPSFRFYSKGWHQVELTAIDDKGCTGKITKPRAVFVEDTLPPPNSAMYYVSTVDTNSVIIAWQKNNTPLFKGYRLNRIINGKPVIVYTTTNRDDTIYTDKSPKINTSGLNYCYSIQAENTCGKVSFASYSHCTILLNEVALPGPANLLSWSSYIGWGPRIYRIYRAGYDGKMKLIDSVPGNKLTYTDTALCDETYCYYVEAVEANGTFKSKSNTTCLHANYVRQTRPVNLRYVTDVNNSAVKLQWDTIGYKNLTGYIIDKYNPYIGWTKDYAVTPDNNYTDNNVDIYNISYNYRVKTLDKCGYTGPYGNNGSSIVLDHKIQNDKVSLHWNAYRDWPGGVKNYKLQIQLKDKSFKTIKTLTDTAFVDDSVYNNIDTAYCYRVIAYNNAIIQDSSVSNRTCAILPSRIFVPNAFTPGNHDSINDEWKVSAVCIYNAIGSKVKNFNLRVFNRWGSLVFETDDYHQGWNGKFKGDYVMEGVYIYLISAEGIDGRKIYLQGNITVLK